MTKAKFFQMCSDHGIEMGGLPDGDGKGYPMDAAFASCEARRYVQSFKFSAETRLTGARIFQLGYFRSRSYCQRDYEDHKRPF